MDYSNAIRVLNNMSLHNNMFLRTFVNTALSTFDSKMEVSIWTSTFDILSYDVNSLDKLVLSVVSTGLTDKSALYERVKIFKEMLLIDFDIDLRITQDKLKIPMVELWSSTKETTVWVDKTEFNFSKKDKGKSVCIPYDYFLFSKPVLFVKSDIELTDFNGEVIQVDNTNDIVNTLPYVDYII